MKNKKIRIIFSICLLFTLVFSFLFISQNIFAVDERPLELDYPTISGFKPITVQNTLLPDYIKYIFNLSLILVGLIAFLMLVFGGFLYLTSAGNPSAMSNATDKMLGSIMSLVILLCSYLILTTINPQLTIFYPVDLEQINVYQGAEGTVTLFDGANCNIDNSLITKESCETAGKKWLDIDGTGTKCIGGKMINLAITKNLNKYIYDEDTGLIWDNQAKSIIYYGNEKKTRACGGLNLTDCQMFKLSEKCENISNLVDPDGNTLNDGKLSSIEVLKAINGVRLYSEENFGGVYQDFPVGINDYACYSSKNPISGNNDFSLIGENRASSLESGQVMSILCKESNGDCILNPGLLKHNLKNPVDFDNTISKICVMELGVCGGIMIRDEPITPAITDIFTDKGGRNDFIPPGQPFQLAKSWVREDSISSFWMYSGAGSPVCEVIFYEKAGLGGGCSTDYECCGREWHTQTSSTFAKIDDFNELTTSRCGCSAGMPCLGCSYERDYKYIFEDYSSTKSDTTYRCGTSTCCPNTCSKSDFTTYLGKRICNNCVNDRTACVEIRQIK